MTEFETLVVSRLDSIDTRLAAIEEKFEEATNFASDMINEEGGLLESIDPHFLTKLMSTLSVSESLSELPDLASEAGPLQALSGALRGFRERLEDTKQAIIMAEEEGSSSEEEVE